jgi:two-component system alkaline phosphatase synthesis response regulator PhoP
MQKILIIEDDKDIVYILKSILELEGYHISFALDGKEGLEMAKTEIPDIIILDLILPDIDGYEICKEIRRDASFEKTHIVMLTAKSGTMDELAGMIDGADDYIAKPFNPLDVVETIKYVLTRDDKEGEEEKKKKIDRLQTRLLFEEE